MRAYGYATGLGVLYSIGNEVMENLMYVEITRIEGLKLGIEVGFDLQAFDCGLRAVTVGEFSDELVWVDSVDSYL